MVQTLSLLCAVQSHRVIQMLARDHRSKARLNLGFAHLQFAPALPQLRQLSFLFRVHLEQQSGNHGARQRAVDPNPAQWRQPETPVEQG